MKQALQQFVAKHPDVHLIEPRFMEIRQAMGTAKGRLAGAAYLRTFVEEMKASGFVADVLKRSGQGDATVAPPPPARGKASTLCHRAATVLG